MFFKNKKMPCTDEEIVVTALFVMFHSFFQTCLCSCFGKQSQKRKTSISYKSGVIPKERELFLKTI